MSSSNIIKLPNQAQDWLSALIDFGQIKGEVSAIHSDTVLEPVENYEILAAARAEAAVIVKQGRAEAEDARQQAYQEGYQCGYAAGADAAKAEAMDNVSRVCELASTAAIDTVGILRMAEEAVVGLALAIAERVVYQRLAEDRAMVLSMVKGALESTDLVEATRVRVSPDDLDLLQPWWAEGQFGAANMAVELVADPSVQMGGCIIDTRTAVLDAQIDTKLAEIEKAFRAELDSRER